MPAHALAIYLNDHSAAMVGEVELARRVARENRATPLAAFLDGYQVDVASQRQTIDRLLETLGGGQSRVKRSGAWLAEKAGRLKLNGSITRYTDLARLLELEALAAAAQCRLRMWEAIAAPAEAEQWPVAAEQCRGHLGQTRDQLASLAEHHRDAASRVTGKPTMVSYQERDEQRETASPDGRTRRHATDGRAGNAATRRPRR